MDEEKAVEGPPQQEEEKIDQDEEAAVTERQRMSSPSLELLENDASISPVPLAGHSHHDVISNVARTTPIRDAERRLTDDDDDEGTPRCLRLTRKRTSWPLPRARRKSLVRTVSPGSERTSRGRLDEPRQSAPGEFWAAWLLVWVAP